MKHLSCHDCRQNLTNDEVAFNLKLFGQGLSRFKCLRCLCRYFGATEEFMLERMEMYKKSGCELFTHKYVEVTS